MDQCASVDRVGRQRFHWQRRTDEKRRVALRYFPFILALLASSAYSQDKATMVSLGSVAGPPKGTVMVPLYLTPSPPSLEVGNISVTIRFRNKGISFVRGEKGFLLDGVNGNIKVNQQRQDDKSLLEIEVATQGEPRKALRNGLVMTLVFNIEDNGEPGTNITLAVEKLTASDVSNPPKVVEPITGADGSIEIISPDAVPYVACFFFTH